MDLLDLLPILRRRWRIVAGTVGAALVVAAVISLVAPVTYTARTQIFVATAASGNAAELAQGTAFAQARVQSYVSLIKGDQVLTPVVQRLHLSLSPAQLAARLDTDAPVGKVLLNLRVRDGSATGAAAIANAVSEEFVRYVHRLETVGGAASPVRLSIIQPAEVPTAPVSPRVPTLVVLAVLGGVVVGGALAVLRDRADTKVHGAADLEALGVALLGTIPFDRAAGSTPLAARADPDGPRAEAFRQLRTTLDFIDVDHPPKIIAVTGAGAGDGRTTTALNLADSLASAGNRVCLVEADLRNPGLATLLGLPASPGLVDELVRPQEGPDLLQAVGPNLAVIVAGAAPPNPNELLSTERIRTIITRIAAVSDHVIIDTPPLLASSDGVQIARLADATLLVVRAGGTDRGAVAQAVENVRRVDRRVSGLVLTMVKASSTEYGGYAAHGYRSGDQPARRPTAPARAGAGPSRHATGEG